MGTKHAASGMTPLAVTVLALLAERRMHPYEMYRVLSERQVQRRVKVRPGTLYHAVGRLAAAGLVEAIGTERDGGRPERTSYRITAAGTDALEETTRELICAPHVEYPRFPVGLAEAHNLPRAEVVRLLRGRIERLQRDLDDHSSWLADRSEQSLEAYHLAGFYAQEMQTAELRWLCGLVARLENKEIPWPKDGLT